MKKLISVGIFSALMVSGCGMFQANTPTNETAKVAVATMTAAVTALDSVCYTFAKETNNGSMLATCGQAYSSVSAKLDDVNVALNNNSETFVCAVAAAESALEDFANVYVSLSGQSLPEVVIGAEAVAKAIGSSCSGPNAGVSAHKLGIKMP